MLVQYRRFALEQNKFVPPVGAKPIHKKLEIGVKSLAILQSLIAAPHKYPQSLKCESIYKLGWESMWRDDDLSDEEEEIFINFLNESSIRPLYVALGSEIFEKNNLTINVAETANPCSWTMSYLRGGCVADNQRFFNDLTWMTSVYFSLPIQFLILRNGDSMRDSRIVAGPTKLLQAIKEDCPSSWKSGLPV